MQRRWTALLIALLVASMAAWYLTDSGDSALAPAGDAGSAPSEVDPEAPLVGRGPDDDDNNDDDNRDSSASGSAAPTGESDARLPVRGFVLRGRLLGPAPLPPEVHIQFADEWGELQGSAARIAVALDGRFVVAVDEEIGSFTEPWLSLVVDHPAFMRVTRNIARREFVRDTEHVRRATTEIALRSAGSITGRVVDGGDRPIPSAQVAFIVRTKPNVAPQILDAVLTDPGGRYVLRAPKTGTYEMVVVADGLRPDLRRVEMEVGNRGEGPTVVLVEGAVVSGRLLGQGRGIEGALIAAAPANDEDGDVLGLGPFQLTLRGDRVLHHPATVETMADGVFRLAGLFAGDVVLTVEHGGGDSILHYKILDRAGRRVRAPAAGVEFEIALATLVIEARVDGKPTPEAEVRWAAIGKLPDADPAEADSDEYILYESMSTGVEESGRKAMQVSAGGLYAVAAELEGYKTATRKVRAPASGGRDVVVLDLEKAAPKPVLELRFQGAAAASIAKAYVAVFTPSPEIDKYIVPPGQTVEIEDGRAEFEVERVGTHVYVHPGGSYGMSVGYWLPVTLEIELPQAQVRPIIIPLRSGCGLELDVRDASGGPAVAGCHIESADGTKQRLRFVRRHQGGLIITAASVEGPSAIHPPLPPGTYTIVLSRDGAEPLRKQVKLVPGKAVHVELTY